jgi:hypothetical protein
MADMSNNLRSRMGRVGVIAAFALLAAGTLTAAPVLAAEGEGCPNEQVRKESNVNPATGKPYSVGLPECRAYEMVSPLDKQAHDANVAEGGPLVSPDGDAIGFGSEGAFAGAENYTAYGFSPHNTYIARRKADGWTTESALAPASVISKPTGFGFNGDASLDLSTLATCGFVADVTRALGNSPNYACALREPGGTWAKTPTYTALTGETSNSPAILWGSSSNLSDMVWQPGEELGLLPGDYVRSGYGAIYETTGLGGGSPKLQMISVNNENTPLTIDGGDVGPLLGGSRESPNVEGSFYQAISSDGQTVYFTAEPAGGGPLTLYARTSDFAGATPASPTTVAITEGGTYVGASADGSKVFFTTTQPLAGTDHDNTSDLYEYDFDSPPGHHYIQVSAGGLGDPSPGSGADVELADVVALSSDGSHIYFSSKAVLTTLPNGNVEHAVQGRGNVYGYDTETEQTRFVADVALAGGDKSGVQMTPDGRYLVFTTATQLSPGDTNIGTAVYRYDFQTGELTWLSHPAPGFTALNEGDNATLPPREGAILPVGEGEKDAAMAYFGDARRAISEDGEYIVFTTAEKLQAADVSGTPQVYLWHDGAVSLISDGQAPGVTEAPGMSASGSDIVFATSSKLVGQDTDNLQDIYDARINGGFPAPTPEPSCSGEACQGSASGPPAFGSSGTSSYTAGGNLTPGSTSFPAPEEPKPKALTQAQKLTKALKQCEKDKSKKKRTSCQKEARKKYGTKTKSKSKK